MRTMTLHRARREFMEMAAGLTAAIPSLKDTPIIDTVQPQRQEERTDMSVRPDSTAVAVARAHVEAWSHHDFDKARGSLATDVHVTATTTQPIMAATDLTGIDDYMEGLIKFAQAVIPGSARVSASVGDEQNALLMVTLTAALGPGGSKMTLPAARLYLLDEHNKIKAEQVVFFAVPE